MSAEWSVKCIEKAPIVSLLSKVKNALNISGVVCAALICGGMFWKHLSTLEQLRQKKEEQNIILEQLFQDNNYLKVINFIKDAIKH